MFTRIDHVMICVPDLPRGVDVAYVTTGVELLGCGLLRAR